MFGWAIGGRRGRVRVRVTSGKVRVIYINSTSYIVFNIYIITSFIISSLTNILGLTIVKPSMFVNECVDYVDIYFNVKYIINTPVSIHIIIT